MKYEVVITREGKNWLAECPTSPGAIDYGTSLPRLIEGMKDAIILDQDLPDDAHLEIKLVPSSSLPAELAHAIELANRRAELAEATTQLRQSTKIAANKLLASGYSIRDTASALGITPGRVQQLAR